MVELWLAAGLSFLVGLIAGLGLSVFFLVRAAANITAVQQAVKKASRANRTDVRP